MAEQKNVEKTRSDAAVPDDTVAVENVPDEDETRRRFREALELKQKRRHATAEAVVRDGSEKSHGAQGPTKGRTFRRKSV